MHKSICEMRVGEAGYVVDWAAAWPYGLDLVYGVSERPHGTLNVPIKCVSGGFVVGATYTTKFKFPVGGKFYPITAAQIQDAKKNAKKEREEHRRWLKEPFREAQMPYIGEDARLDVGNSTDWLVGIESAIKKWKQRAVNVTSYLRTEPCGICFVARNRGVTCSDCIAHTICRKIDSGASPKVILRLLEDLKREEVKKMDEKMCSEFCADFKPKPPFPQGLRTADLKRGMVVTNGDGRTGFIYTILEAPSPKWVKVLRALAGHTPLEQKISLGDHGCQPYASGVWNQYSWLREVK